MCQCGTNTHVPREKEVKYVFYNAPFDSLTWIPVWITQKKDLLIYKK